NMQLEPCVLSSCVPMRLLRPPTSPLSPYTTLFRSYRRIQGCARGCQYAAEIPPAAYDGGWYDSPCQCARTGCGCCRAAGDCNGRSEEHTSELQSRENHVCRLLLENNQPAVIVILAL